MEASAKVKSQPSVVMPTIKDRKQEFLNLKEQILLLKENIKIGKAKYFFSKIYCTNNKTYTKTSHAFH